MPITKSAKKALRGSKRKAVFNLRRKNAMKEIVKKYRTLVAGGKTEEARSLIPQLQSAIDKATKRGVIKKGGGSRRKSRLAHSLVSK